MLVRLFTSNSRLSLKITLWRFDLYSINVHPFQLKKCELELGEVKSMEPVDINPEIAITKTGTFENISQVSQNITKNGTFENI